MGGWGYSHAQHIASYMLLWNNSSVVKDFVYIGVV